MWCYIQFRPGQQYSRGILAQSVWWCHNYEWWNSREKQGHREGDIEKTDLGEDGIQRVKLGKYGGRE